MTNQQINTIAYDVACELARQTIKDPSELTRTLAELDAHFANTQTIH